jgi:hypothetical protein
MANHRGNGVDDGFREGASDLGWKPAELIALLGAEGNRVRIRAIVGDLELA